MFYSYTFISREGLLWSVWCAAHKQDHLLNKRQYTAMNIPKIVGLIMDSPFPMSYRYEAHLLAGIVRIYSKKLEFLYRDCNLFRTQLDKALRSPHVDLPEDARQAPVESVTFPQSLNLDDFELEDDTFHMEFDYHIGSEEDITLTDQYPTGIDPYVAITFDEDIFLESSPMDVDQSTVPVSKHIGKTDVEMAYEAGSNNVAHNDTEELPEFQIYRSCNLTEALNPTTERSNANSPGSVPDIEKRRDAAYNLNPAFHSPFAAQHENVRVERSESLDEILNDKEPTISSLDEEVLDSSRGPSTFEPRLGSPSFAGSEKEHENFVHSSLQLALQPTTPPPPPQTRPRKRKYFDKASVLTNKIMKKRLEDPSDTVRKRKKLPSSTVGLWRLNNQSKKGQIFDESLFTGFSDVLRSVFEKDCVSSKPYLAISNETSPEPAFESSPTQEGETEINPASPIPQSTVPDSTNPDITVQQSPGQQTETVHGVASPQSAHAESVAAEAKSPQPYNNEDIEIEHFRDGGFPEYMPSPPPRSSPYRTNDFTTEPETWETRSYRKEPSTSTVPEDLPGLRNSRLSASPEMRDEELDFLEVGGNTPVRSPAIQDSDGLFGRTRALSRYLKERCSSSSTSSHPSRDLSLSKILAGKSRTIAARMFFETMVLKSRGVIDMQQGEPYSDITLKLMPGRFSKAQV